MVCCYSLVALLLLLILPCSEGNTCTVGSVYDEYDEVDSPGGWWYLNLKKPSSCSGRVTGYDLYHYELDEERLYYAKIALWTPVDDDTYQIVEASLKEIEFYNDDDDDDDDDDDRRKKRNLNFCSYTLSDPVLVGKGSVMGVYLRSSFWNWRPLPVIGERNSGLPEKGVCKTSQNSSATSIDCTNGSNEGNYLLHVEAEIDIIDCGSLNIPQNGIINYTDTQYGAIAQYRCETGYELIGNEHLTCLGNGSWNGSAPECNIFICDDPGIPENGQRFGETFTYESILSYSCDFGYELIGNITIICEANEMWNASTPTCEPVDCGDPGIPDNSQRSEETFTYQSILSYSCNSGYELIGNVTIICEADEKWNASTPTCQPVDCDDPGIPDNSQRSGETFTYQSILSYSCNSGYELIGSVTIICEADEMWNASTPTCQPVDCGDPGIPDNSQRSGDNFTYQSILSYSCNSGYELIGNVTIICEADEMWNASAPTCQPVDCGDPGIPDNSQQSGETFTYQSILSYSCNSGYELIGSVTIICETDEMWNASTPTCQPVDCDDPGIPKNGNRTGELFTYQSVVSYSCDSGYNLIGNITITCEVNTLWNASAPTCQPVDCGNPGIPDNGERSGETFTYQSILSYSCNSGYELIGSVTIICEADEKWNASTPTCQSVDCGDPGIPKDGNRSGELFTYQSNVTYSCDSGYQLIGNTTITCEADEMWNPPIPTCQPVDCGDPGIPENGQRTGDNFTYKSIVSYSCDSGYELIGDTTIICKEDNLWNTSIRTCNPIKCGDPGSPENGHAFGDVYTYNSEVTFNCNAGYELEGSATITCQANGFWNDAIPHCLPVSCGSPDIPTNGSVIGVIFTYQSTITYMCDNTFHLDGSSSSTCKPDKHWSHEPPTCLKICSDPGIPTNGERKPSVSYITEGLIFTYTCNPGYLLSGDMQSLCRSDGNWNGSLPTCSRKCEDPQILNNGSKEPNEGPYIEGVTVEFTCEEGYELEGVSSVICKSSGEWSDQIPQCILGHDPNSTSQETPARNDSTSLSIEVGVIIGVILFSVILLGLIAFLILFYVNTTLAKKRKYKLKSTNGIDKPMMHVPALYNDVRSTTNGPVSPYEIPLDTLNKQPLSSIEEASSYEIPVQTLKKTTGEPAVVTMNRNNSSVHETVFNDKDEDCTADLPPPITTIEDIEIFSDIDNHGGIINEANPTITSQEYSEIDELGGINNDIYLSNPPITSDETEKYSEIDELGGINNDMYLSNPPISSDDIENYSEINEIGGINNATYLVNPSVKMEKCSQIDEPGGINNELYLANLTVNKPSRSQSIYVLPATDEDLLYAQLMRCNISKLPEAKIHLGESIGSGYFGNVYKAKMEQGDKDDDNGIEIAVKTLQKEAKQQEKIKFLQEAALMAQFHHTNVLKIIGVVAENNTCMIVTELMSKGDLQKLLNKMRPDPGELISSDTPFILLNFCRQICLGMTYLSGKGFVHRDLAARNILVSADNICKVADFGMSRDLEEENYYLAKEGAKIPIKWTAPEALNYRKYSTASDVWSFGCLMYEVWSMGCKPFMEMTNFEAFEKINAGYRLPPSPGCPKLFYELMIKCWHPDPKKRPTFNDIMLTLLQQDQTILNIPEEDLSTHPQAGILGSNLNAGENMYKMLQNTYITS